MRATVLPEKQLRHVLEKQGLVKEKNGDYTKNNIIFVVSQTFLFCLHEIEICKYDWCDGYDYICRNNFLWSKEWFVPNSIKE